MALDPEFVNRMMLVAQDRFGGILRPGWAQLVASGSASRDDLIRISTFAAGLDRAMQYRLAVQAQRDPDLNAEDIDLLDSVNEPVQPEHRVRRLAGLHATGTAPIHGSGEARLGRTLSALFGNPTAALAGNDAVFGKVGHTVGNVFSALQRFPGFVYDYVGLTNANGVERLAENAVRDLPAQVEHGYNPGSFFDQIAFNWSHGEAQFNDLGPVRDAYGKDAVNAAQEVFYYGGAAEYNQALLDQVQKGQLSPEDYNKKIDPLDDPNFEDVYDAVNRQHRSFGRDFAHLVLPQGAEDGGAFTAVSAVGDAVFDAAVDPTLAFGKAAKSALAIKYGVEATDEAKIFRLYGAVNPITGERVGEGSNAVRANVQDFLDAAGRYRSAVVEGDQTAATAELAYISRRHARLTPLLDEVNGNWVAITPEERALAKEQGTTITGVVGGQWDTFKARPIETIDDFAGYVAGRMGLARVSRGLAPAGRTMIPGRMGFLQERKAIVAARRARTRTAGQLQRLEELAPESPVVDYAVDADQIIPNEAGELLKQAAIIRGDALYDEATHGIQVTDLKASAKVVRAKYDALVRRLHTMLPDGLGERGLYIPYNYQGGEQIERLAREWLPRAEATRMRYLWQEGTEAQRRELIHAMILQMGHASGLSRTEIGRRLILSWEQDIKKLADTRRYGVGDTDLIPDASLGSRRTALNMSQIESGFNLPSFTEWRRAASKSALLGFVGNVSEGSFRELWKEEPALAALAITAQPLQHLRYALFSSSTAERAFGVLKLGWLLTFSNSIKNSLDEYGAVNFGGAGSTLRYGKDLTRETGGTAQWIRAFHHLIPAPDRRLIKTEEDVFKGKEVGNFRILFGDQELSDVQRLAINEVAERRAENEALLGSIDANNAEDGYGAARELNGQGIGTVPVKWNGADGKEFAGWGENSLESLSDGGAGMAALAKDYALMFANEDEPARRVLAYVMWSKAAEDPEFLAQLSDETLETMQRLVPVDDKSWFSLMADRHPEILDDLTDAEKIEFSGSHPLVAPLLRTVKDYVAHAPETARFRQLAEALNTDELGRRIAPGDEVARQAAVDRYVTNQVVNVATSVYRKAGDTMNVDLVSRLLNADIPAAAELRRLGLDELPERVIAPQWLPLVTSPGQRAGNALVRAMTKAYEKMTVRPQQALVRRPLYTGSYARIRELTLPWEKRLVEQYGFDPAVAGKLAQDLTHGYAMENTLRYIDNARASSQFSVLARNWWLFERAQEDALRRWGRVLRENPETIRYAQLAIYNGQNVGLVHEDDQGNLTLTYPGSGAIIEAFMHAGQALGIVDGVKVPHVEDLTTQLSWITPTFNNPLGFSATPMVSLPWRLISGVIPGGDLLDQNVTMALEGQLGSDRHWWETLMPTPLRRVTELFEDHDSLASMVGGASATALLNASVLGQVPDGSDPRALQEFISNTQTQTLNGMIGRALFAFIAPGPPSRIDEYGSGDADFAWRDAGIEHLDDEFRALVGKVGLDKALVIWQHTHPERLAYAVGKTEIQGAPGAQVGASLGAVAWVFDHKELFDGPYRDVAAYFIPSPPGEFDQAGWNAMTQIGIRQYKEVSDYFQDVATAQAKAEYFTASDNYQQAKKEARLNGSDTQTLDDAWAEKKAMIFARYPLLRDYLGDGEKRAQERLRLVGVLDQMANDPSVDLPDISGVREMLDIYHRFQETTDQLKGQRGRDATAARDELAANYETRMGEIVKQHPELTDLYQGIFRWLD
jgi:hypothetical protein